LTQRSGQEWSTPVLLSATSPYDWNGNPAISDDGSSVLFECGLQPYVDKGVCEVSVAGDGFRVVVPALESYGTWSPDFAPDGSIVYELETAAEGETVQRIPAGGGPSALVNGAFRNDNSPCVLPDGRIASLWLGREGGQGFHELKIMNADGSGYFMLRQDLDILDIGLGCGGP
jgi:hypothetical protein